VCTQLNALWHTDSAHAVVCLLWSAGLSSAVVFLVHPSSEPSPSKLQLLIPPLAAGCHCLVAINGPSRLQGLAATTGAASSRGQAADRTTAAVAGKATIACT
jgi:hypothetical protein